MRTMNHSIAFVHCLYTRLIVIIENTIEVIMEFYKNELPIIMLSGKLLQRKLRYCQHRNGSNMCSELIFLFDSSYSKKKSS